MKRIATTLAITLTVSLYVVEQASAYLAGGMQFGPFTSRNLTPNPNRNNLPAGLRLDQFITLGGGTWEADRVPVQ